MITRDGLYAFIESLITAAVVGDALYGASSFRTLRGSVDEAAKVIRVECLTGELTLTDETKREELNVRSTIQCWVLPATTEVSDLEDAIDDSFDMAKAIYKAIAAAPSLSGTVCDAQFREFETGFANLAAAVRGVTYLDGLINEAS